MRITEATKLFISNATANNSSLKLRFYGVNSPEGLQIGADIDTILDTDLLVTVDGYQIAMSPEVLSSLKSATIHVDRDETKEGIILFNCK